MSKSIKEESRNKARMIVGVALSIVVEMANMVWKVVLTAKRKVVHFLYFDHQKYRQEGEELLRQKQLKKSLRRLRRKTEKELVKSEIEKRKTRWGSTCR